MNEPTDIELVRAEALRKLGRNIVKFSKIEAGFKHLLAISQIRGNPKNISDQFRKNQSRLSKQTLGSLVQEFNKNIMGETNRTELIEDISESEIYLSFKIYYNNPEFLKAQKCELSNIVFERNRLLHQDLALLNTTSIEDYRNLIVLLDKQNPRLLDRLEKLRWMFEVLGESWKELESLLKSSDFREHIQANETDA